MDFIKKNYEKVLMGVVLLGLVVGAASLPVMISGERASLQAAAEAEIKRAPKPLAPLDLAKYEQLLARMQTPFTLDLATTNKLVNPMTWRKRDGVPVKELPRNIGPEALVVTRVSPLYLTITLDGVSTNTPGARYVMSVEKEAARIKKKPYYPQLNLKNDTFVLREVKGPADNPTEMLLELNDTGERAVVTKDKPFRRVDGYVADLKYPPENNRVWSNQRVGGPLRIEGEDYIIVAINKNEVILSAKPNGKKTSIPYNADSLSGR